MTAIGHGPLYDELMFNAMSTIIIIIIYSCYLYNASQNIQDDDQ